MATGRVGSKDNSRKFEGSNVRPDKANLKQVAAAERQAAYDALSLEARVHLLDDKLGKGVGAVKQRAKLASQLRARDNTKSPKVAVETAKTNQKAKDRRAAQQALRPGHDTHEE
jgi:hypothetical protein